MFRNNPKSFLRGRTQPLRPDTTWLQRFNASLYVKALKAKTAAEEEAKKTGLPVATFFRKYPYLHPTRGYKLAWF